MTDSPLSNVRRFSSASGSVSTAMMPVSSAEIAAGPCTRASKRPPSTFCALAPPEEKNDTAPTCSDSSRFGDRIDRVDGDGLQVRAEHGLDRALPTRLDDELLGQARTVGERIRSSATR